MDNEFLDFEGLALYDSLLNDVIDEKDDSVLHEATSGMTSLENKVNINTSAITEVNNKVNTLKTTTENNINALSGSVSSLKTQFTNLSGSVVSEINDVETRVNRNTSDISSLNTNLNTTKDKLDTLYVTTTNINTNLTNRIKKTEYDTEFLKEETSENTGKIEALEHEMATTISNVDENILNVYSAVTEMQNTFEQAVEDISVSAYPVSSAAITELNPLSGDTRTLITTKGAYATVVAATSGLSDGVKYVEQSLTDAQKLQVRENIGLGGYHVIGFDEFEDGVFITGTSNPKTKYYEPGTVAVSVYKNAGSYLNCKRIMLDVPSGTELVIHGRSITGVQFYVIINKSDNIVMSDVDDTTSNNVDERVLIQNDSYVLISLYNSHNPHIEYSGLVEKVQREDRKNVEYALLYEINNVPQFKLDTTNSEYFEATLCPPEGKNNIFFWYNSEYTINDAGDIVYRKPRGTLAISMLALDWESKSLIEVPINRECLIGDGIIPIATIFWRFGVLDAGFSKYILNGKEVTLKPMGEIENLSETVDGNYSDLNTQIRHLANNIYIDYKHVPNYDEHNVYEYREDRYRDSIWVGIPDNATTIEVEGIDYLNPSTEEPDRKCPTFYYTQFGNVSEEACLRSNRSGVIKAGAKMAVLTPIRERNTEDPTYSNLKINFTYGAEQNELSTKKLMDVSVDISSETATLRTRYSDTQDIVIKMQPYSKLTNAMTIWKVYLGDNTLSTEGIASNENLVQSPIDMPSPITCTSTGAIWANHGYYGLIVKKSNHGITDSLIGAHFTDNNGCEFVLQFILNENELVFSPVVQGDYGEETASWKSGDAMPTSLTYNSVTLSGFEDGTPKRYDLKAQEVTDRKFIIDGVPVGASGDFSCDEFSVVDTSMCWNPANIDHWDSETYDPVYKTGREASVEMHNSWTLRGASVTFNRTIIMLHDIATTSINGWQVMMPPTQGEYKSYSMIPDAKLAAKGTEGTIDVSEFFETDLNNDLQVFNTEGGVYSDRPLPKRIVTYLRNDMGEYKLGCAAGYFNSSDFTDVPRNQRFISYNFTTSKYKFYDRILVNTTGVTTLEEGRIIEHGGFMTWFDPSISHAPTYCYHEGDKDYCFIEVCNNSYTSAVASVPIYDEGGVIAQIDDVGMLHNKRIINGRVYFSVSAGDEPHTIQFTISK